MMSSLAEASLALALAVTCASVILLHRRLRRLGGDLAACRAALAESLVALDAGGRALGLLINEGRALAASLDAEIKAAKALGHGEAPARPLSAALHRFRSVAGEMKSTEAA